MIFKDAYEARLAVEAAFEWLHEDGWTREDISDLSDDSLDLTFEDDEA